MHFIGIDHVPNSTRENLSFEVSNKEEQLLPAFTLNNHSFEDIKDILEDKLDSHDDVNYEDFTAFFIRKCYEYKFSPAFVLAIISIESNFKVHANSYAGAVGLMQLIPATGKSMAKELNIKWEGKKTLLNPKINLELGLYYLSFLRAKYNKDPEKYLAAYNLGPTKMREIHLAKKKTPTGYVKAFKQAIQLFAYRQNYEKI